MACPISIPAPLFASAVIAAFLTACSTAQLQKAQSYQDRIATACQVAMMIGTLTTVEPWVVAGCSTEAAIARLALDPTSFDWVTKLIADARKP